VDDVIAQHPTVARSQAIAVLAVTGYASNGLTHGSLPDEELPQQRMGWTHYLPRLAVAAAGGNPGEDPGP
jgi:hypothetical protein